VVTRDKHSSLFPPKHELRKKKIFIPVGSQFKSGAKLKVLKPLLKCLLVSKDKNLKESYCTIFSLSLSSGFTLKAAMLFVIYIKF